MKQARLDLNLMVRKTRKQVFLEHRDKVVPRDALVHAVRCAPSDVTNVTVIHSRATRARNGRVLDM